MHTCTKTITSWALAFGLLNDTAGTQQNGALNAVTMKGASTTLGSGYGGNLPSDFGVTITTFPILRISSEGKVATVFNNNIPDSGEIVGIVVYQ